MQEIKQKMQEKATLVLSTLATVGKRMRWAFILQLPRCPHKCQQLHIPHTHTVVWSRCEHGVPPVDWVAEYISHLFLMSQLLTTNINDWNTSERCKAPLSDSSVVLIFLLLLLIISTITSKQPTTLKAIISKRVHEPLYRQQTVSGSFCASRAVATFPSLLHRSWKTLRHHHLHRTTNRSAAHSSKRDQLQISPRRS